MAKVAAYHTRSLKHSPDYRNPHYDDCLNGNRTKRDRHLIPLLSLLATAIVAAPPLARADDPQPKFGGCLGPKYPNTCFAPSVSLSLVAVDLKTGSVITGVAPGVGYGVTFFSDERLKIGVDVFATFRDTSAGQRLVPSIVASFAEFFRLGVGYQLGSRERPFVLMGFGANFGNAK